MIKDLLAWVLKYCLQGVMWVLILSISWKGETLFERGHNVFVDNDLVELLNEQVEDIWVKVEKVFRISIAQVIKDEEPDAKKLY